MKRHAWAAAGLGALVSTLAFTPALAGSGHGEHDGHDGHDRAGHWPQEIDFKDATRFTGEVTDLDTSTDAPTDGVEATAIIARGVDGSIAGLKLRGFEEEASGTQFGAHVHTGPCVEDEPETAGPHYNHDVATGREPVRVDRSTEVWFDLVVSDGGTAGDGAIVPFVVPEPQDGAASIVLHEEPTDHDGEAGGRSACIPLD
ncbi:hypothetical protein [Aeromicrobium sp. CTD01-1L150]|uniref:hypothetical protein n=1 Tax=Aeromicrobium sp. CTD01-1L150 TaxID=3341830 RepID=UPI0035C0C254